MNNNSHKNRVLFYMGGFAPTGGIETFCKNLLSDGIKSYVTEMMVSSLRLMQYLSYMMIYQLYHQYLYRLPIVQYIIRFHFSERLPPPPPPPPPPPLPLPPPPE